MRVGESDKAMSPEEGEGLSQSSQKTREKAREKILRIIKESPEITTSELSAKSGITIKGIEWNIAKLKKEGFIKRAGPDKGGHWEVIK